MGGARRLLGFGAVKLSVIVPSLDGTVPASLRRAVEAQEEVELVVVAGVSPVGRARNEGLARATGDYIAWVDADDSVEPDYVETVLAVLARPDPPEVVTFDVFRDGWEGERCLRWRLSPSPSIAELVQKVYQSAECLCVMWQYVTRRDLWRGLSFDEILPMAEDYLLLPQLLLRAKSLAYLPRTLYHYCRRADSLVHQQGFLGGHEVLNAYRRRFEEAPAVHRSAAGLGLALKCFAVASRVVRREAGFDTADWRFESVRALEFVRRRIFRLLSECLFRTRLTMREKTYWTVRLVWMAFVWPWTGAGRDRA